MDYSFLVRFAVTYDCNTYGTSTYNNNEPCVTAATGTAQDGLATTGWNIGIGITAGIVLVVVGVVLLMKLHRKKAPKA